MYAERRFAAAKLDRNSCRAVWGEGRFSSLQRPLTGVGEGAMAEHKAKPAMEPLVRFRPTQTHVPTSALWLRPVSAHGMGPSTRR